MKKTILITGGAGYIGTVLTDLLLSKGYKVIVYDRLMYDGPPLIPFFSNKNFEFVKGDILDIPNLDRHMKRADVVIHLAAMVGYMACDRNKILTKNINVEGINFIDNVDIKNANILGYKIKHLGLIDINVLHISILY